MADGLSNITILGDKGYVGEKLHDEMREQGICLMSLNRSNSKNDWSKSVRQLIFRLRRRVETVFSQLSEQLNAERVLAKSFQGLCTRLANKSFKRYIGVLWGFITGLIPEIYIAQWVP